MVFAIHQYESVIGVCVSPPSWTPLPPPSPPHPSRLSRSTGFGRPASYIKLALVIYFTHGSKGDTDVKNRVLVSVGEGESGILWENSIETCTLPYVPEMTVQVWCMKQGTQSQCSGATQIDRVGRGWRGVQDGEAHLWPLHHYNTAVILQLE